MYARIAAGPVRGMTGPSLVADSRVLAIAAAVCLRRAGRRAYLRRRIEGVVVTGEVCLCSPLRWFVTGGGLDGWLAREFLGLGVYEALLRSLSDAVLCVCLRIWSP